jgi:DNA-directed RNA polymerase subunit H
VGGVVLLHNKLVPNHELLTTEETEQILEKYGVTRDEMPKIKLKDPAIMIFKLDVKPGDIIKITRDNPITGTSYYYRVVVEG